MTCVLNITPRYTGQLLIKKYQGSRGREKIETSIVGLALSIDRCGIDTPRPIQTRLTWGPWPWGERADPRGRRPIRSQSVAGGLFPGAWGLHQAESLLGRSPLPSHRWSRCPPCLREPPVCVRPYDVKRPKIHTFSGILSLNFCRQVLGSMVRMEAAGGKPGRHNRPPSSGKPHRRATVLQYIAV